METKKTLVIGASENPERYAYKAAEMLQNKGHQIVLLGKSAGTVAGETIHTKPRKFEDINTVTLYLNPQNQEALEEYIIDLKPQRVIFNPGTENGDFAAKLQSKNIQTTEACTLVLLSTGQY
jgi:hypothetical protein